MGTGQGSEPRSVHSLLGQRCALSWAPKEEVVLGMGKRTGNGLPSMGRIQRVLELEGGEESNLQQ